MLTPRQSEILKAVVQLHIDSGEAVGSVTVGQHCGLGLSPATIRKVLAELEEAGYLHQPHTSAGRIPSDQGFRVYADSLLELGNLREEEKERILAACEVGGSDPDLTLREACAALAEMTRYVWMVRPPGLEQTVLRQIQFIGLAPGRVLAIVVAASGQILNRAFAISGDYPRAELTALGDYLSERMAGHTLAQAREILQQEVKRGEHRQQTLRRRLLQTVCDLVATTGTLIVNGQGNLLAFPEMNLTEKISRLFRDLEGKKRLINLLDQCLNQEGVHLFIGSEAPVVRASGCSVVATAFAGAETRLFGTLGLLGPTRLDYAHAIPLVDFAARTLSGRLAWNTPQVAPGLPPGSDPPSGAQRAS